MGPYYETTLMDHLHAPALRDTSPTRLTCQSFETDGSGVFSYGVIMLAVVGIMALFDLAGTQPPSPKDTAIAELSADYSSRP